MARPVSDCGDPALCPTDLCCYGECHCAPSASQGDRRRLMLQALGLGAAALAVAGVALPVPPRRRSSSCRPAA